MQRGHISGNCGGTSAGTPARLLSCKPRHLFGATAPRRTPSSARPGWLPGRACLSRSVAGGTAPAREGGSTQQPCQSGTLLRCMVPRSRCGTDCAGAGHALQTLRQNIHLPCTLHLLAVVVVSAAAAEQCTPTCSSLSSSVRASRVRTRPRPSTSSASDAMAPSSAALADWADKRTGSGAVALAAPRLPGRAAERRSCGSSVLSQSQRAPKASVWE